MSVNSPTLPTRSLGFSRTELLIVTGLVGLLMAVTVPLLAGPRPQQHLAVCANNLRQIGQALLSFADVHGDHLPPIVRPQNGGSNNDGTATSLFSPVSNYLASPRLLICPASIRRSSASFETLRDANISYLFGAHATPEKSWEILSGDLDIQGGSPASCSYLGNVTVTSFPGTVGMPDTFLAGWSTTNHVASGNLLLSDGSVAGGDSKHLKSRLADSSRAGPQGVHLLFPR